MGVPRRLLVLAVAALCAVTAALPLAARRVGAASAARRVLDIAAGAYNGYALLSDGDVWAWGDDLEGQIGDGGRRTIRELPVEVRGLSSATLLAGGANSVYALSDDGMVWAWGDDFEGELGGSDVADVSFPRLVGRLTAVRGIAAGAFAAYALRDNGTAWSWGDNAFGQLGTGSSAVLADDPQKVALVARVVALAAGTSDGYALLGNGRVWGWGADFARQLGDGACPSTRVGPRRVCLASTVPRQVRGLAGVLAIAAGGNAAYALVRDGTAWAWGDNECGELGDGNRSLDEAVPVQVRGLREVVAIAAGSCSAYAVLRNGTVWAWGEGEYGQLGDGSDADHSLPVQVRGLSGVVEVAAGGAMAYALERNGSLWAWGDNAYGQLGDGSLLSRDVPVRVLGLTTSR